VSSPAIVEDLDVLEGLSPQLCFGRPRSAVDQLLLQRSEEALSDGFPGDFIGALPVNSVIHPAGLPINTSTIKVLRGPVESSLASLVGVMHQSGLGRSAIERHLQRVGDEL
jgi:hypothetical protein